MAARFVGPDLLRAALNSLAKWSARTPKQASRHVWSVLPPKLGGAGMTSPISYEENDDFAFMDRFLRQTDEPTFPYFDPLTREWLPAGYPHSNLATFRKKTFVRSWGAAEWNGSEFVFAADYGKRLAAKALSKAAEIHLVPALPCAVWFFKRPDAEWPGSEVATDGLPASPDALVELFRTKFGFLADPAWGEIFDPSPDLLADYGVLLASGPEESMSRDQIYDVCRAITSPSGGVTTPASPTGRLARRTASAKEIGDELRSENVEFPEEFIRRITSALTHSHVRLLGPPGTGKTTLARAVLESVVGEDYKFAVATGQWTGEDVVGGPVPDELDPTKLVFRPGLVLRAADENKWIGIDEINRADIDVAFGELFGLLAGFDIDLPYAAVPGSESRVRIYADRPDGALDVGEYGLPRDWRMVATMNSWDKVSLNRVSFAFSRRWCTVFVPVPEPELYAKILDGFLTEHSLDTDEVREALRFLFVKADDPSAPTLRSLGLAMGPGIARSCVRDVAATTGEGVEIGTAVAHAVDGFVLPQLEGALEQHEDLAACLDRTLTIAGAVPSLLHELDGKLSVFTGRRHTTTY